MLGCRGPPREFPSCLSLVSLNNGSMVANRPFYVHLWPWPPLQSCPVVERAWIHGHYGLFESHIEVKYINIWLRHQAKQFHAFGIFEDL